MHRRVGGSEEEAVAWQRAAAMRRVVVRAASGGEGGERRRQQRQGRSGNAVLQQRCTGAGLQQHLHKQHTLCVQRRSAGARPLQRPATADEPQRDAPRPMRNSRPQLGRCQWRARLAAAAAPVAPGGPGASPPAFRHTSPDLQLPSKSGPGKLSIAVYRAVQNPASHGWQQWHCR